MIWCKDIVYEIFNYIEVAKIIDMIQLNHHFYHLCKKYKWYQLFLKHRSLINCSTYYSAIIKNNQTFICGHYSNINYNKFTPIAIYNTSSIHTNEDCLIALTKDRFISNYNIKNVVAVAMSELHTLILTTTVLYFINDAILSILLYNVNNIDKIACGYNHSIILIDGKVYGLGWNSDGQLGTINGDKLELIYDQKVVIDVVCGAKHTLLLTIDNDVYGLGANVNGELGLDCVCITEPTLIIKNIKRIYCGDYYSLFLTIDNKVYCCGYICINYHFKQLTKLDFTFDYIGCGAYHYIYRLNNNYYGIGVNNHYQLGSHKYKKYNIPLSIKF